MKNLLLFLFFLVSLQPALAQIAPGEQMPEEMTMKNRGWDVYIIDDFNFINKPKALNALLVPAGYDPLGGFLVSLGGGIAYRMNRFRLGYEGTHTIDMRVLTFNEEIPTRIRRSYTQQFYASFDVYKDYKKRIYPFVGISGTEARLQLLRQTEDRDFNSLLYTPGNAIIVNHFQSSFTVGIGISTASDRLKSAGLVGYKMGYRFGGANPWFSNHTRFTNAPVDRMNSFYIQFLLGGAFNQNSRSWF